MDCSSLLYVCYELANGNGGCCVCWEISSIGWVCNWSDLFELDFLFCTHAQFKLWPMTFVQVRMIHQFDSEAVRPLLILNVWVCLLNSRIKWFLQIRKLGICLQQLQVLHLSDSVIWNLNFVIYINLKVNLWRSCKSETARVRSPYLPRHLCGLY